MKEDYTKLSLENIGGGVAAELFDRELNEVMKNIFDPNCEADKAREITLTFTILPSKGRDSAAVKIAARAKLAAVEPAGSMIFMAGTVGQPEAYHYNFRQGELELKAPHQLIQGGKEND